MLSLLLLHFALAVCAKPLVDRLGRKAFLVLAVAPAATAGWALSRWDAAAGGGTDDWTWAWIPDEHLDVALRLDALSCLMTVLVGAVGALVLLYCAAYFGDREPRLGRFAGAFTAFAGSMLGLVLADDLILLYVFWELTTVFSWLLIGQDSERRANRRSALQALLVTTLGGLSMLVGFVMLGEAANSFRISEIVDRPPEPGIAVSVAVGLVLLGALSKSAIWPFSLWLPSAMTAPSPVSAYLHAAAMVKAGVYLLARLAPAFADTEPWRPVVLVLGSATMLLGGWRALRLTDLKLLLAHGTVSQLGFLAVLTGAGQRNTALAGVAVLGAHALFKSCLFLVTGIVEKAAHSRDLRRLSGVGRSLPGVCAVAVLAAASMAGLPPLIGFAAKEAAFESLLHGTGGAADRWALAAVVAGSVLTAAYSLRFLWGAFARKHRTHGPGLLPDTPVDALPSGLSAAPALLAAAGLLLGPAAGLTDPLLAAYADTFPGDLTGALAGAEKPYHLALWHGIGPALLLSVLTWAAGALLFALRRPLLPVMHRLAWPRAERAFRSSLLTLERVSLQLTGAVQRGSLSFYLGIALVVLTGAQIAVLATERPWPELRVPRLWDSALQGVTALAVVAGALLCLFVRQRMKAVVLVGLTGYGAGGLFVLQGAPDLALTQFAVETVSIVVFVLVLRRLPARFTETFSHRRRAVQGLLAVCTGVLAAGLTWFAAAARQSEPSGPHLVHATAEEGVKNVVATTLVDLRAWDTLGECAVLAVAAVGVTSLIFLRRRVGTPGVVARRQSDAKALVWATPSEEWQQASGDAPERTWLAAGGTLSPERRSVVFEVIARLTFHPVLVLSLYLLFCAESYPGGGFSAGLVAGLALVVRYLAGGRFELAEAAPLDAGTLLGAGLLVMTGTALGGMVHGSDVLENGVYHGELPLLGPFHIASSVVFDTGIYLLVLGVVLDITRSLGAQIDRRLERGAGARPARPPAQEPPDPAGEVTP
ncbi:Na+/H+ antiporter subunit A [Streptomyces sp. NPDC048845]|uniref:Na+/H+ antiporter subunit A n=1 Tax=Streptomyces sp. NPDC048845 TaxID=3155390 RepID=UPI003438F97A